MGSGSEYVIAPPPAVSAATLSSARVALGDIRLVPHVNLYEHTGSSGFNVGLMAPVFLPTGNDSAYAGEPLRIEPRLAVDYRRKRLLVAFNAGYLVRKKAKVLGNEIDDQVRLGLGAEIPLIDALSLMAEVDSRLNILAPDMDKKT